MLHDAIDAYAAHCKADPNRARDHSHLGRVLAQKRALRNMPLAEVGERELISLVNFWRSKPTGMRCIYDGTTRDWKVIETSKPIRAQTIKLNVEQRTQMFRWFASGTVNPGVCPESSAHLRDEELGDCGSTAHTRRENAERPGPQRRVCRALQARRIGKTLGLYRLVEAKSDQDELFAVNQLFGNAIGHEELDKVSDYYTHSDGWTNRLIQGDSLLVMTSLLEREGMAGQVQCIYLDPPYGIKYGSNWQIASTTAP